MCDQHHKNSTGPAHLLTRRTALVAAGGAAASLASGAFAATTRASGTPPTGEIPAIGYSTAAKDQPLQRVAITRRALRADDILIDILYCGVCHSDIHATENHFGYSVYPVMPGHEIVGRVAAIGPSVSKFKIGDAIGVGCMIDSCGECEYCRKGLEQYCVKVAVQTYGRHPSGANNLGGYSDKIVVREAFALKIPAGLDLAAAAPLLCAGVTTFSPIRTWNIADGHAVAIVGLGGLGHMAVKLAVSRGADVTVFTTTASKKDDALRMGAREVVLWPDEAAFRARAAHFQSIISTIPYGFDPNPFIGLLKVDGTFINVGLLTQFSVAPNSVALLSRRKRLTGSAIGGIAETQEVLDYCAAHKLGAEIEKIPMSRISEAFHRVVNKDVRYRFVIDMKTVA